ncbi:hypothetical protein C8A01DRAFT_32925 [Parachaetomium inaequale]|uniref:Haloacid dehalogenase n=1 Tax=Parachaetomium inaequale TaxID=2588326 RepID=A0AAN6SUW1_9PEZI|nr:hypothetical protein C8A01DRAFT_32925 [Parachaetomium inaequale]
MAIIAFDLYGTLVSTASVAYELQQSTGNDQQALALTSLWRRYQLEYTWRLNSMGTYKPLDALTRASLQHAAADLSIPLSDGAIDSAMATYTSALQGFMDVPDALQLIQDAPSSALPAPVDAYVFSNGTRAMIAAALAGSQYLSPYADVFKGVVSVDDEGVRAYKPDRRAYEHLVEQVGKEGEEVWLVTANPFDAVGAVAAGLRVIWVDREWKGWNDRVGDVVGGLKPTLVVHSLDMAVREVVKAISLGM